MKTFKKPKKCPSCGSNNIYLDFVEYIKDVWGEDTNIINSGSYFCKDCGEFVGSLPKTKDDNDAARWYI